MISRQADMTHLAPAMRRYLIALLIAVWPFAIGGAEDVNCDAGTGLVDIEKCPEMTQPVDGPDCSARLTTVEIIECTRLELKDAKTGPVLVKVITGTPWLLFFYVSFFVGLFFIAVGHLILGSVKGRWRFDRDTVVLVIGVLATAFVGFAAGFLGPILVSPSNAEGPLTGSFDLMSPTGRASLLGVWITGPLGALLGLVGSLFYILKLRSRPAGYVGIAVGAAVKLVAIAVLAPLLVVFFLVLVPAYFNVTARGARASFFEPGLAAFVAMIYVPMMIATLLLGWPLHFLFRRWHLSRTIQALVVTAAGLAGGLLVTVLVMTPDLSRLRDYPALLARSPDAAYFLGFWSAFGVAAALMAWLLYTFGPLKLASTEPRP